MKLENNVARSHCLPVVQFVYRCAAWSVDAHLVGNTVCPQLTHLNCAALEVTATITMIAIIWRALNFAGFVSISAHILGGN